MKNVPSAAGARTKRCVLPVAVFVALHRSTLAKRGDCSKSDSSRLWELLDPKPSCTVRVQVVHPQD